MHEEPKKILESRLDSENYRKLIHFESPKLHEFIADAVELCAPEKVFVCTDSQEDIEYVRKQAVAAEEERSLGKSGVRSFQPMSNLDFVSLPLGQYIKNHLEFAKGLNKPPTIFATNYFIRGKDGEYLTGMKAKYVWVKWMELRANGDVWAVRTPTGFIPGIDDLKKLFREVLDEITRGNSTLSSSCFASPRISQRLTGSSTSTGPRSLIRHRNSLTYWPNNGSVWKRRRKGGESTSRLPMSPRYVFEDSAVEIQPF